MPSARRVDKLFTPSEVNGVFHRGLVDAALRNNGIDLVAVAANTPGGVADTSLSLCGQRTDAICQISDNLCLSWFPSILSASERAGILVFCFASYQAHQGEVLALSRDHYDAGCEGGLAAARVMRGKSPAGIPFEKAKTTRLTVNLGKVRGLGAQIPKSVLGPADEIIDNQ